MYSRKVGGYRPVYEVYDDIMLILNKSVEKDNGRYKERILGRNIVHYAPSEYHELSVVIEHNLLSVWYNISIVERMRLLAKIYLKGMIDVVDAHWKAQEEDQKSRIQSANAD